MTSAPLGSTHNPSLLAGMEGGENAPGIRGFVGGGGSGKTFAAENRFYEILWTDPTSRGMRLDFGREVVGPPRWLLDQTTTAASANDAKRDLDAGKRLVIVRVPFGAGSKEWAATFDRACAWALESPTHSVIHFSEAHLALPTGPPSALPPFALDAIAAYRRNLVSILWDTPRIAMVNHTLVAQSNELSVFNVNDTEDRRVMRSIGRSDELLEALDKINERFEQNDRGWHVRLGLKRRPPYELVKITPRVSSSSAAPAPSAGPFR